MILLLISLMSFAGGKSKPVTPIGELGTVVLSGDPGASFVPLDGFYTKTEKTNILAAGKKVNEVIKSECFHDVLSDRKMIQTGGRNSQEVIDDLRKLNGSVTVKMYSRCMRFGFNCFSPTSAVAYRVPPKKEINLNRVYFNASKSVCEWASTMAHEYSHAIGEYDHSYKWTPQREFSVPYSINHAFSQCCN